MLNSLVMNQKCRCGSAQKEERALLFWTEGSEGAKTMRPSGVYKFTDFREVEKVLCGWSTENNRVNEEKMKLVHRIGTKCKTLQIVLAI